MSDQESRMRKNSRESEIKKAADALECKNFVVFTFGLRYKKNGKGIWKKQLTGLQKDWEKFTQETPQTTRIKNAHNALGIVTGESSNLFVVDIDNLQQWQEYLEDIGEKEPETVTEQTGSGGRHLLFKYTDEVKGIMSSTKMIEHKGKILDIDVRTSGGMIICAPTRCEVEDEVYEYKWLPGKSPFEKKLAEVPEWLITALSGKGHCSQTKGTSSKKVKAKPQQSEGSREALESFLFDQYGILATMEPIKYYPESEYYIVQSSSKLCPFVKREHSSNHQYCVIKKDGIMVRKCHSKGSECKDKEYKPVKVPPALFELIEKECKGDLVSPELIKLACQEGSGHVMDVIDEETSLIPHVDKTLIGQLSNWSCAKCKGTRMQVKLGPEGSRLECLECGAFYPKNQPLLYNLEKYLNLQKYMNVVFNINNTNHITNNYYGSESTGELTIGWNHFVDDPITVFNDITLNKLLLKAMSGTHSRIADLFVTIHQKQLVYCPENSIKPWYQFELGWKNVEVAKVKQLLRSDSFLELFVKVQNDIKQKPTIVNAEAKAKQISQILMKLETDGYQTSVLHQSESQLTPKEFFNNLDKDRSLLGFNNGVYDLQKGEFRTYRESDLVTLSVGYDYDEALMYHDKETIQEINRFIFSVFPDEETCRYVIKFMASCLAGYTDDQLFHFGYGTGSNGKGILIKLMLETLGQYGGTLSASFLTGKTPDADAPTPALTNIVNKRFVAISETVEGAKINEQLFKSMCGQDKLVYRPMRQEAREFEPDFKLFMVCNDLPEFKGSDYAMKRRIRVIPFKSSFKENPDKNKGEKTIDKTLNGRVRTWRHAFMGLLLQGYQLYVTEGLVPSEDIKDATKKYEEENNTYALFLEECCMKQGGSSIQVSELGRRYMEWSISRYGKDSIKYKQENKYTPKLTEELEKNHWEIRRDKLNTCSIYSGLAWKP